jgi:hypothetical protein
MATRLCVFSSGVVHRRALHRPERIPRPEDVDDVRWADRLARLGGTSPARNVPDAVRGRGWSVATRSGRPPRRRHLSACEDHRGDAKTPSLGFRVGRVAERLGLGYVTLLDRSLSMSHSRLEWDPSYLLCNRGPLVSTKEDRERICFCAEMLVRGWSSAVREMTR